MKKALALLLSLVMVLALLTACGGSGSQNSPAPSPAASDGPTASPSDETPQGPAYDKVKLMFATTYNEGETSGQAISYFTNYITEKSGGAVTFDIKWGGTVAGTGEELSFLQSGAFDMSVLGQSQYSDVFPLLNFPGQTGGSQQKCMEYFTYIFRENPETSAMLQAEIEKQGVKMLGFMANGGNAFAAKKPMTTLDELNDYRLGVGMNHSAYESLGFVVQAMMPWDGYDSLSKGIVDVAFMSMGPMVALKWHEVAPYFVSVNEYSAGNYFTISLERWNSLNADTQALFQEAMDATAEYTVQLMADQEAAVADALKAAGGELLYLDDADSAALAEALFRVAVTDCRALAKNAGCEADMETMLQACADYLNLPLN